MESKDKTRKTTKIGTVIGKTMKKTVKVQVVRQVRHPLYKKSVKLRTSFLVHDEFEKCNIGDVVRIVETRPISKKKHWRVMNIVGLSAEPGQPLGEDKQP
ncbi:MAG: 30S ribosomal protein S17 [Acidobacteriota bacterium]|nr:30S ribosomal protein S17 [Acidobacteriota bacterium]